VKTDKGQYMLDFYQFENGILEKARGLREVSDHFSISRMDKFLNREIFTLKNNVEYRSYVKKNNNVYSLNFMKTRDLLLIVFDNDQYSSLVTVLIDLELKSFSNVKVNNIPNDGGVIIVKNIENNIYQLATQEKNVCKLKLVKGDEFVLYNSNYAIRNDNGSKDIY
jgi:hypothetical protein